MAAEWLLLPVVQGVVGKAADELVQSITRMWGVDDDRERLERLLLYVQSLLPDAEAKSETNLAIRTWMKALKAVAYKADDVLDDFQYEALRREAQGNQSIASKLLSNFTSKDRLVLRYKASRDLKDVLDKIDELATELSKFGLAERVEIQHVPYRQTHSLLDKSEEVYGRDDDKEALVKLLLDQQNRRKVQVLPIIGMGATPLLRSVIELATKRRCGLPENVELLRGRLQEVIGRKRFLLVLDDVWNEVQRKWEDDLKPLLCSLGGSGSMIVVTSRSRRVASIMGTCPPYGLVSLSEHDSWELFSKKAFSKEVKMLEELIVIGRRIVNKCKGLPLALKTMGGLMNSKQQTQDWEAIADCNISDTSRGKDEVMSILKLSYKHLSPEMKQCFAFCAVFPKDYEIEKDILIQLWMANDTIYLRTLLTPPSSDKDLVEAKLMPSRALCFKSSDVSIVHKQLINTSHLRYLDLSDSEIVSLPDSIYGHRIEELEGLQQLGNSRLKSLPDGMDGLTALEGLTICECPRIEEFPEGLLQRLPYLTFLGIRNNNLERCCREGGEYFHLISSIPRKDIGYIEATVKNQKRKR
ncbi:hypothetical protein PR202_gb02499 [Eleusine coracana subsp. coracana]|uniref:Uncharacterized protein n=1 Tax=Eleusine coracana subsp. coracana TaxID=191504 RepID=A0AAV5DZB1_ELECO|nr:hypothetical protein PR202_gb02499 [Eleusine coracana subsp. coracana]